MLGAIDMCSLPYPSIRPGISSARNRQVPKPATIKIPWEEIQFEKRRVYYLRGSRNMTGNPLPCGRGTSRRPHITQSTDSYDGFPAGSASNLWSHSGLCLLQTVLCRFDCRRPRAEESVLGIRYSYILPAFRMSLSQRFWNRTPLVVAARGGDCY